MTKHDVVKAYFEPKVSELAGDILNFNFVAAVLSINLLILISSFYYSFFFFF